MDDGDDDMFGADDDPFHMVPDDNLDAQPMNEEDDGVEESSVSSGDDDDDDDAPPFPDMPHISSCEQMRNDYFNGLFGRDAQGHLMLPEQPDDPDAKVRLPVMIKFVYTSGFTKDAPKGAVSCILLAIGAERGKDQHAYVMYYEGCPVLDHIANQGHDGEIYPWATLSGAGKKIYQKSSNGWRQFVINDEGSHHDGVELGTVRSGVGFTNTLNPEAIEAWEDMTTTALNNNANYALEYYFQERAKVDNRLQMRAEVEDADSSELRRKKKYVVTADGRIVHVASKTVVGTRKKKRSASDVDDEVEEEEPVARKRPYVHVAGQKYPLSKLLPPEERKKLFDGGGGCGDDDGDASSSTPIKKQARAPPPPPPPLKGSSPAKKKPLHKTVVPKKESKATKLGESSPKKKTKKKKAPSVGPVFTDDEVAALHQSHELLEALPASEQKKMKDLAAAILQGQ